MSSDEELYAYYFSDDILSKFSQRFSMEKAISEFISKAEKKTSKQIDNFAKQELGKYSQELLTSLVNSEKNHMDRTGDIIYQVAEKTGIKFPSIPQRLIELGFMSTRPHDRLAIPVSTPKVLTIRASACAAYVQLKSRLGEEKAKDLPCKYGCIANSKILFDELNIPVELESRTNMHEKGYCEFTFQSRE